MQSGLAGHRGRSEVPDVTSFLPSLNATLNGTSAILLSIGHRYIRQGRAVAHRACMLAACATSTAFLAGYVVLHARIGMTRYAGQGWIRPVYFAVLASHTVLAVCVVPLAVGTLTLALRGRFVQHGRLARWTFPVWLYVSVTGVLVYVMLYHL
jgi:putative membrane protein